MRAHRAPASPLPPSTEGRITRLAAVHVKASCDLKSLLDRAGLRVKDIEDATARIGVQNQIRFLELASEAIGDPLLGFHLAGTFDPRELGLLYYVQASSATLGEALACMARYISVAHEGLQARCVDRDGLKVRISYVGVPRHADRQQMEALMTALVRIGRQLTGHRSGQSALVLRTRATRHRRSSRLSLDWPSTSALKRTRSPFRQRPATCLS